MYHVIVCSLDKDGRATKRYREQFVERHYQAITIADHWDSQMDARTGKREFGTAIIRIGRA